MGIIFEKYGKIIGAIVGIILAIGIIYLVATSISDHSANLTGELSSYVSTQIDTNEANYNSNGGN